MNNQFRWQSLREIYRQGIRHPKYRWLIILGTLFYLVNPIDIAPDALPGVGWIDDGVVATLLVTEVSQLMLAQFAAHKQKQKNQHTVNAHSEPVAVTVDAVSVS